MQGMAGDLYRGGDIVCGLNQMLIPGRKRMCRLDSEMLKIWNDHHSSACVRFMNSGMLGGCQYDFTSPGVTIVGQGSRGLFLLLSLSGAIF